MSYLGRALNEAVECVCALACVVSCDHTALTGTCPFPGFSDLSQDDQLILVKAGFFEIWLARMARMFHSEKRVVLFEDGSVIPRNELEIVYSVRPDILCKAGFTFGGVHIWRGCRFPPWGYGSPKLLF